jgi:allophanate hydrolase subunit 2
VGEVPDAVPPAAYPEVATVRVLPGPRDDWFVPAALAALTSQPYVVTPACDRVGMRLAGPALERREDRELPSEGTVTGALQVPPDGRPILFLADHPVTGGYPVIGVVLHADLPAAAQLRPGQRLRFRLAAGPAAGPAPGPGD